MAFDTKLIADAKNVSPEYADLISLATRQTIGSFDITALADAQGNVNASDIKIFMKDVGGSQYVTLTVVIQV